MARWKKFHGTSTIFIGVRGQFQENASIRPLRFFWGTRVHSDVLRVTFLPEFKIFFVELDHRSQPASPRGLCWGIGQKPYTLETSDLSNSWEYSWINLWMENFVLWVGKALEEVLTGFVHFFNLLITRELIAEVGFSSRVCCWFQGNWNLAKFRRPGICEIQELEGSRFENLGEWWSSRTKLMESGRIQVKDVISKVRVWSVNWWQACKCMKLAPQITGCKRYLCTCSH
jgi:hypothetical protein